MDKFYCKYCNKELTSQKSLIQHELKCPQNPNRNYKNGMLGKTAWNKGLTKEDPRIQKQALKASSTKKGKMTHYQTEEAKIKLRKLALERGLGGFNMHKIKYEIDGNIVDSSYEKLVADSLSKNNIKWERGRQFKYKDLTGKQHTYTPDFYLPDYNIYLDPKNDYLINNINPRLGYKDVDKIKWVEAQNDIKILILDKEHLTWDLFKENLPL